MKSILGKKGFTLLELLVVTAILGILVGVSTSVFIGILRSQNKTTVTNEVRQNASLAIDLFERDVRSAESISPVGDSNEITLIMSDATTVTWECLNESMDENGKILRDSGSVTNEDTQSGVSVSCGDGVDDSFDVTSGTQQIVTFKFSATQGIDAPQRSDFNINLQFETSAGTRVF